LLERDSAGLFDESRLLVGLAFRKRVDAIGE
jgi:hypothetical protein